MVEKEEEKERLSGKRHLWVSIMGVPGSGKTSLLNLIEKELDFHAIYELPVEEHPLFEKYYKDPEEYAYSTQIYFAYDKWLKLKEIKDLLKKEPVFSEPIHHQDFLYAQARFENNPWLFERYDDFFHGLFPNNGSFVPDITIYLKLGFENMMRSIAERAEGDPNRLVELEEKKEYWQRLWQLNEEFVKKNRLSLNMIVIKADCYRKHYFRNKEMADDALLLEFLNQIKYACIDPYTEKPRFGKKIIIPEVIVNHRPPTSIDYDMMPCKSLYEI